MLVSDSKRQCALRACVACFMLAWAATAVAAPLLPDLIAWADQARGYMYGGTFDTTTIPNRVLYRFSQPIPNIGAGALELREETHPDNSQDIYQRIFDSEGGVSEVHVGTFDDIDPPYGHMYLKGIGHYRFRTVTAGNGVGPVVSTHEKISYALVDGTQYNLSLPGAPPTRHYTSVNAPLLGISVGWADFYRFDLPGQWADATGLADGQYWLETEIDPFDRIEESDETNNVTRILVNLVVPDPQILPGDYNGNGIVNAADYTIWRNTLGTSVAVGTGADGDADGEIDGGDFDVWRAHFGDASGGGGGTAVPEPAGIAAAILSLAAFGLARPARTVVSRRS